MGTPVNDMRPPALDLLGLEHPRRRQLATPARTARVPDPLRSDPGGRS